jgi:hypothetical protein
MTGWVGDPTTGSPDLTSPPVDGPQPLVQQRRPLRGSPLCSGNRFCPVETSWPSPSPPPPPPLRHSQRRSTRTENRDTPPCCLQQQQLQEPGARCVRQVATSAGQSMASCQLEGACGCVCVCVAQPCAPYVRSAVCVLRAAAVLSEQDSPPK